MIPLYSSLKLWMRITIFLSSYGFIFVLVLISSYFSNKVSWTLTALIVSVAVWVISLILFKILLHMVNKLSKETIKIGDIKKIDQNVAEYLVAYLLPFAFASITIISDLIVFGIVIILIAAVIMKTDLLFINPFLMFLGYYYFLIKAIDTDYQVKVIVHKDQLEQISLIKKIRLIHIDFDTYYGVV